MKELLWRLYNNTDNVKRYHSCSNKLLSVKILFHIFMGNITPCQMEQRTFKNVNNCLNANIYSYLEMVVKSSNLYLNVVNFFNNSAN